MSEKPSGIPPTNQTTPSIGPLLPASELENIRRVLLERGVALPCPRCGPPPFNLEPYYLAHPIQINLSSISLGGANIPTVVTTCMRCGFLSEHALGVLGLLSKSPNSTEVR